MAHYGSDPPRTRRFAGWSRAAAAAGVVVAAVAVAAVATAGSARPHHAHPEPGAPPARASVLLRRQLRRPIQAVVTIRAREPMRRIPRSFLGFSTEYWTLPVDERHIRLYKRILGLLHVADDGRFVLRIGGDSSDHAFWDPTQRELPEWAFDVTPSWLTRTARVVRQMHLRVIIDLNTITSRPRVAAQWARAALARLPRGSVIGFEIGNEPDIYDRGLWADDVGDVFADTGILPRAITPASYARQWDSYAHALSSIEPDVRLLGPALALPRHSIGFISTLLRSPHPGLSAISLHRYPYSECEPPGSAEYPTIQRILSERASAGVAQSIVPAVRLAHAAGLPVEMTELNSVTCGGVDRISDSFATALWAPDTLFELVRAGIEGVDVHVRVFSINAPFRFDARGVQARPFLYGLILFTRMLGPDSRLVPVVLHADRAVYLKVWAVRVGRDRLNVLVLDKGARSATVALHLPATSAATVQRLLAPTARSTGHVILDGQRLNAQARWTHTRVSQAVAPAAGVYRVGVRGMSAALLTVRVAPSVLAGSGRAA